MNPDLLKVIGITTATIISAPFVIVCVRAAMFFGAMSETVRRLGRFVEGAERKLEDHEGRITTIEAERETELRYERRHAARRANDPSPRDAS